MADDTNLTPAVEAASAEATSKTKEKKTRAPRKPKAAAEAADTSVSAPVKKTRGPAKKSAATSLHVAAEPAVKASAPTKKIVKTRLAKRLPQKAEATLVDTDGFADLLKLEEENQKLRKSLSDKLRAENADLRKKLGLD